MTAVEFLLMLAVILAGFTVLAAVADLAAKAIDRRDRDRARAEDRAERQEETVLSDAWGSFSWQD